MFAQISIKLALFNSRKLKNMKSIACNIKKILSFVVVGLVIGSGVVVTANEGSKSNPRDFDLIPADLPHRPTENGALQNTCFHLLRHRA